MVAEIRHKLALGALADGRRFIHAVKRQARHRTLVTSAVSSADSSFVATTNVYAANNLNQYETVRTRLNGSLQTEELSYDANGNLASNGDFGYSYDALSRLTFAYNVWTGSSISNEYDHLSRRVRKVSSEGNHVYFYDGWNLVLELIHRPDNTTDRIEYYWGPDISGTLQGAGGIGGLLYLKYNDAIYIPFYDAYGNILGYWNASGDVVASYTYDAFGKAISSTGPLADVFSFRYSTKYFDPETELYYYGYRYYSPELRRWITRDPIEEGDGPNLYTMCENGMSYVYDVLGNIGVKVYTEKEKKGWLGMVHTYRAEVNDASDISVIWKKPNENFTGRLSGAYPDYYKIEKCNLVIVLVIKITPNTVKESAARRDVVYTYKPHVAVAGKMSPAYGIVSSKDGESFPIYEGVLAHERAHAKFFLETILPEIKLAVKTITSGDEDEIKRRLKSVLRKNASGDAEAANKATVDWFGVNGFQLEGGLRK